MEKLIENLPQPVARVCQRLFSSGHSVHLVGGAIRDLILGRPLGDFDVATSADPQQVMSLFEKVVATGLRHGTVTVIETENTPIEVTTYRTEGPYFDGRHPQVVNFVKTIEQDLGRRDFTVNALALAYPTGELVDPFGGQTDIANRTLRAVGDPAARFREDGLRLLRACRFCATLDFEIDIATREGMVAARNALVSVSAERQRDEIVKALAAQRPARAFEAARDAGLLELFLPELQVCVGFEQNSWHVYDVFEHTMKVLDETAASNLPLRLAALFHDIGKPATATGQGGERHFYNHERKSAELAEQVLVRLKFATAVVEQVVRLIAEHMWFYERTWSDAAVRRFVRRIGGSERVEDSFALRRADILGRGRKDIEQAELELTANFHQRVLEQVQKKLVFSIGNLPIDGRDVMQVLAIEPGPQVGVALRWLLEEIEDAPEKNNREAALELIKAQFGRG